MYLIQNVEQNHIVQRKTNMHENIRIITKKVQKVDTMFTNITIVLQDKLFPIYMVVLALVVTVIMFAIGNLIH